MHDLISSGQFAQLTRMTRKALRLYDELGLLRPAHTDSSSGYRFYSHLQLEDASRINTLRGLGMPLLSIQDALRDWHGMALRTQLETHRQVLKTQLSDTAQALQRLEHLLEQPPQRYQVQVYTAESQQYLGHRGLCSPEEACLFFEDREKLLRDVLRAGFARPSGAARAIYHEADDEAIWDVEVCLPFTGDLLSILPADVYIAVLPGGQIASTVHEGEYGDTYGMQGAYTAVWRWMQGHGLTPASPPQEVYLLDYQNADQPQDYRTEIGWRVRPSS
jgi:DNA-binding transcriptional MerR regulator/effector-binding domain-containing protein